MDNIIDDALLAISPLDGRYSRVTAPLKGYFSEYALIKHRIFVEIAYLKALHQQLASTNWGFELDVPATDGIFAQFSEADALRVKALEQVTNHDVKAVEYFIKEKLKEQGQNKILEWVHFGLTSQDINNTAFPLMLQSAYHHVLKPALSDVVVLLRSFGESHANVPMLSRTHGQAASPTLLGKEIAVWAERMEGQLKLANQIPFQGKFGGAVGNFNAHYAAFPDIDWHDFGNRFLRDIGLERQQLTTQIEHYDMLAAHFQSLQRCNTILIDFCRDIWTYISMDYFTQKVKAGEIGSSAMPHKVNPIDFENAEGNLGLANAVFSFLAAKLPISRLQRDLTDSTVLRNVGVPYGHTLIALRSIIKGWNKLVVNNDKIATDLSANAIVLAEAIQTILRRESFPGAYELMKELTRGNRQIDMKAITDFIQQLDISQEIKEELAALRPENYTGRFNHKS